MSATLPVLSGLPFSRPRRSAAASLAMVLAAVAVTLGGAGCEDKAIGRVCDVQADGGTRNALVNGQALECPTRICLRQATDVDKAQNEGTTSLCTAECSKDKDCEDGELRNSKNANDHRCKSGFVCGVATWTGSFCCKKLCLCKDFITIPQGGLQTPIACDRSKNPEACPLVQK